MENDHRKTLTLALVAAAQMLLSCSQKCWQEGRKHGKLAGREEVSETEEKRKKGSVGKGKSAQGREK